MRSTPNVRTDTTFGCPLVGRRELENNHRAHREKVKQIRSSIDTRAPPSQPHLTMYGRDYAYKKKATTEAAFSDLKMIQTIARTMTRPMDLPARRGPVSLHGPAKGREIDRIMSDNYKLLERLENLKPSASTSDMIKEHRWKERYVINASHTKRLTGEYDYAINKNKKEDRLRVDAQARASALRLERMQQEPYQSGSPGSWKSASMPCLVPAGVGPPGGAQDMGAGFSASSGSGSGAKKHREPRNKQAARFNAPSEPASVAMSDPSAYPQPAHTPYGSPSSQSGRMEEGLPAVVPEVSAVGSKEAAVASQDDPVVAPPVVDDDAPVVAPPVVEDDAPVVAPAFVEDDAPVVAPPVVDDEAPVAAPLVVEDDAPVVAPPVTQDAENPNARSFEGSAEIAPAIAPPTSDEALAEASAASADLVADASPAAVALAGGVEDSLDQSLGGKAPESSPASPQSASGSVDLGPSAGPVSLPTSPQSASASMAEDAPKKVGLSIANTTSGAAEDKLDETAEYEDDFDETQNMTQASELEESSPFEESKN